MGKDVSGAPLFPGFPLHELLSLIWFPCVCNQMFKPDPPICWLEFSHNLIYSVDAVLRCWSRSITFFCRRYVHQPDPAEEVEEEEEENGGEENDEENEIYKNQTNGVSGGNVLNFIAELTQHHRYRCLICINLCMDATYIRLTDQLSLIDTCNYNTFFGLEWLCHITQVNMSKSLEICG